MKKVLIFDIDGTLTNTRAIDEASYNKALKEVFDIQIPPFQRKKFNSSADSGFLRDIFLAFRKENVLPEKIRLFKKIFLMHLEEMLNAHSDLLIKGADTLIASLKKKDKYIIAFATGAWLESAQLKLKYAGLLHEDIAITTANEGMHKEDILKLAFDKIANQLDMPFQSFYIGDRHWDYLAAESLGIPFIGVGGDEIMLKHVKNKKVLIDLSNIDSFLAMVNDE